MLIYPQTVKRKSLQQTNRPCAGPVGESEVAVVRWRVWIVPEISEAAVALFVGSLKAVVTAQQHIHMKVKQEQSV